MFKTPGEIPEKKNKILCELCGKDQGEERYKTAIVTYGDKEYVLCPTTCKKTLQQVWNKLIEGMRRLRGNN